MHGGSLLTAAGPGFLDCGSTSYAIQSFIHSTGRDDSGSSHGVDHRTPVAPVVGTLFAGQIDAKIRAPEGLDAWRGKAANEASFEVRIQWVSRG